MTRRRPWGTRTWPKAGEVWIAKRSRRRWLVLDAGDKLKTQASRTVKLCEALERFGCGEEKTIMLDSLLSNYECEGT